MSAQERLSCDVAVVGAGPAGLAFTCRLMHLAQLNEKPLSLLLLEKASRVGGHLLSGALLDPTPLDILFPRWREEGAPARLQVAQESLHLLTPRRSHALPLPAAFSHHGLLLTSLGDLCRWLATRAETLGAEILPGFPAVELLEQEGRCIGVRTGDRGRNADGTPAAAFQPGTRVEARLTVLAEGCRGYLTQQALRRWNLAAGRPPQTHGLGFKELWQTPESHPGTVLHTIGWPLDRSTHGGGFLYHLPGGRMALGFITALDYPNPWLDPFAAFQQWKHHPLIAPHLRQGRLLASGARTLTEGGWQSLPELLFHGGMLVGDGAGFLDPARLQGVAPAMMSGIMAADAAWIALCRDKFTPATMAGYPERWRSSKMATRMNAGRNVRPGFRAGRLPGLLHAAWEGVTGGREPWTLGWSREDRACLRPAAASPPCPTPLPDGQLSFDRPTFLNGCGLRHAAGQPVHLQVTDREQARLVALGQFAAPEERYCPGGVYRWQREGESAPRLEIQPANCLHCRTCDIKDPAEALRWTPPEGNSGPEYRDL